MCGFKTACHFVALLVHHSFYPCYFYWMVVWPFIQLASESLVISFDYVEFLITATAYTSALNAMLPTGTFIGHCVISKSFAEFYLQ